MPPRQPIGGLLARDGNSESLLGFGDAQAPLVHHAYGHLDVGPRDQRPVDFERGRASRERSGHKQAAEELAADIALDADAAARHAVGFDDAPAGSRCPSR